MGFKKRDKYSSLFDAEEIASYSDQENLAVQQQEVLGRQSTEQKPNLENFAAFHQTFIDDSAVQAATVPGKEAKGRFALEKRQRCVLVLAVALIVVYLVVLLLPQDLGSVFVAGDGAAARFKVLFDANIDLLTQVLSGRAVNGFSNSEILIYALIALVGAGLSTVGAAYQGSFRNALATPSTLGVMSGASVGLAVYILVQKDAVLEANSRIVITAEDAAQYTGTQLTDFSYYLMQLQGTIYALVGALTVVVLVVLIAKLAGRGKMSMVTLVVAGQVFAALANSFVVLFRLYLQTTGGQEAVSSFASMQTGDFSTLGNVYDALFLGAPILVCVVLFILLSGKMNVLAFGDDEARLLGIRVGILRGVVVAFATVMTALIVSFVGAIGFVGFLIPHMTKRFVGPDFRYLIPASALAGGIFLLVVQYIYSCLPLVDAGIGVVTTCIGAVVFLFAVVRERRAPRAE